MSDSCCLLFRRQKKIKMDYLDSVWGTTQKANVNIRTDDEPTEQDPGLGSTEEITAIIIILCIFSVIGTLGNGLVLYVFTRTAGKLTSTIFILALAITDFITCLLIIPFTVTGIYLRFMLTYDLVCKVYQFLITCNVPLSAFIMVAIAVDRYICICHPFVHVMTVKRAKCIVYILAAFAIVLGIITSLGNGVYMVTEQIVNVSDHVIVNQSLGGEIRYSYLTVTNKTEYVPTYTGLCYVSTTILSNTFIDIYQKVYSSFYLISLLIVMVLYGMIYSSVTKQRAKRRKQKLGSGKKVVNTQCQTDESTMPLNNINHNQNNHKLTVQMEGDTVSTSLSKPMLNRLNNEHENGKVDTESHPINRKQSRNRHDPNKERRDHDRLANIKTAIMLFIVTLVFIIAFLPAWLMALQVVDFNVVVFYMYFAYNVANPIIYAFMNKMFRDNLEKLFASCRFCFHN